MTQKSKLSRRDLEQLSAYLDGELSARDLRRLEARLAREPFLQRALDELRNTVAILGLLPEVKPPRSFLLTPQAVGQVEAPRPSGSFALQWATVLATLALVVVVGLDALAHRGGLAASMAEPQELAVEMEMAAPAEVQEPAAAEAVEQEDSERAAVEATRAAGLEPEAAPTATPEPKILFVFDPDSAPVSFFTPLRTAELLLGLTVVGFAVLWIRSRRRP